jgi:hypothetical protein
MHVVHTELVKQANSSEHFESVLFDELQHFLVEHLLVFAFDKLTWKHLSDPLSQKVRNIAIIRTAFVVQKLVNFGPVFTTQLGIRDQLLLLGPPVFRQRTVLAQVVIVVELLLLTHHMLQHALETVLHAFTHSAEPENLLHYFRHYLVFRHFRVKHMFLEESIFAVHVCAEK